MMLHHVHRTLILLAAICLASSPAYAGLVGYWTFDGNLQDSSGMNNNGTFYGGAATYGADRQGTAGKAIQFDGIDDRVGVGANGRPTNNFSFGGWIKTALTHEIDTETNASTSGVVGQHFAFGAQHSGTNGGAGLSIGTNGISVYEHGDAYMPALAVYNPGNTTAVGTGWNHVLVVYQNRQPTIYLNGVPVRTGVTSAKPTVYAPVEIGGGTYGWLNGAMDDVKVWNYALSPGEVATLAGRTTLVTNGSFERDTFDNWPGYIAGNAKISHWTASTDTSVGLSPSTNAGPNGEAQNTFANNGRVPDGNQVAFLHSNAKTVSLTQSVSGFDPGQQYMVVYRENARAMTSGAKPNVSVTLGNQTVVTSHAVAPVDTVNSFTKPYRYIASSLFTATGATHDLQFTANAAADSAALIDAVQVLPMHLAFSDNFNVQNSADDINPNPVNDLPGRQGGFVGPLTYNDASPSLTQLNHADYPGALRLGATASAMSLVSPNRNFKDFSSGPMHFVVEVDVDPTARDTTTGASPWAAVVLGASSQKMSVNQSDGIGILFRDSGGYQIFDGTDGLNDSKQAGDLGWFEIDKNDWYHVRINYYVPAFDDVTPGNVAIFVDDKLIYSGTTDSGFLNNYLVLMGMTEGGMPAASHGFDNLRLWVSAVPEPSTVVLVGLGGVGLLVVRKKKRGRIFS